MVKELAGGDQPAQSKLTSLLQLESPVRPSTGCWTAFGGEPTSEGNHQAAPVSQNSIEGDAEGSREGFPGSNDRQLGWKAAGAQDQRDLSCHPLTQGDHGTVVRRASTRCFRRAFTPETEQGWQLRQASIAARTAAPAAKAAERHRNRNWACSSSQQGRLSHA